MNSQNHRQGSKTTMGWIAVKSLTRDVSEIYNYPSEKQTACEKSLVLDKLPCHLWN